MNCQQANIKKRKTKTLQDFCGGSDGKQFVCNAGDPGSVPGSRKSPGTRNGYPLQCSSIYRDLICNPSEDNPRCGLLCQMFHIYLRRKCILLHLDRLS